MTGLGLVVEPSLLSRLLFGSDLNGAGEATGRIAGLVMLCLAAAACWPRASEVGSSQALAPLLALSVLAALYLIFVGLAGTTVGVLLWPAAAAHADSCDPAHASLDESARGEMTETPRGGRTLARFRGGRRAAPGKGWKGI